MPSKAPSADTITKNAFNELLAQYPTLINTISESRGAKDGQKTLQQLDEYRYVEALKLFSGDGKREMELADVKSLVEWKLRHGKFRPSLMNLASSNPPSFTKSTIASARSNYRTTANIPTTLAILTKLKGIGPATASLLLTVHDPEKIIFFSDEAFYWLCCAGQKSPVKYNAKEYDALREKAEGMVERLGVSATDVEKVAYVIMKGDQYGDIKAAPTKEKMAAKDVKPKATAKVIKPKANSAPSSTKRKTTSADEPTKKGDDSVRRSKRLRP